MNATNTTLLANLTTNKAIVAINFITDIVGYYLISAISFFGIPLNIFMSFILRKKDLKHSYYKYLRVKAIIDLLICILGVGYLKSACIDCPSTNSNTYETIFYQWYLIKLNIRTIVMISFFE